MPKANRELGISIIIPVYNRERYIAEAINSIINQEYDGNIEIIISDDGSTDKSIEIAKSYQDNRIIIVEKPKSCNSQGAAGARNRGILVATQPYICFLDSDDYQLPGFLVKMVEFISSDINDFVFCRTMEHIENATGSSTLVPWTKKKISALDIKYLGLTRSNIINTNCFLFRRAVFDKVGFFNEQYANAEDADLWIRIGELFKAAFLDFVGVVRRSHEGEQLTKNHNSKKEKHITEIVENALIRNSKKRKNAFRIYKLKNMLLNNSNLKKSKYIKARLKLMISYPIQSIKHLYLLIY